MSKSTVTVSLQVEDPERGTLDVEALVEIDSDPGVTYGPPESCVEPSCDAEVIEAWTYEGEGIVRRGIGRTPYELSDEDAARACELALRR